jgi:hypothetical protein
MLVMDYAPVWPPDAPPAFAAPRYHPDSDS